MEVNFLSLLNMESKCLNRIHFLLACLLEVIERYALCHILKSDRFYRCFFILIGSDEWSARLNEELSLANHL